MNSLSSPERAGVIDRLKTETFDLAIIGGGITGAGIALDAASRGLNVALVEKADFASGTSSKSTKLVHGGLRYLKQLEIGLVREVGRERAIVHRMAPHLVVAEKMLLPLVQGGTYGELATSMGLWVYDVLAGVEGDDKRVMLSREETLEKEPLLRHDILQGGGYYAEYRTDDARLTLENIKTAAGYGALSINYVEVVDFRYDQAGKVTGIQCRETLPAGAAFDIRSHFVVNAAGPWVDTLRRVNHSLKGKKLFLSKGVHIVVPHERFPVRQSVYFDIPDGRMIFAIPRNRVTYIGTTDTPYDGDLNQIPIYQEDVDYLIEATNSMFPEVKLRREDVESSWAGLRPLIYEEGKSASEMSRRDEIFESESGLISIAGGKLTGYRKMAERIVDRIGQKIRQESRRKVGENHTHRIAITGGPFSGADDVEQYKQTITAELERWALLPHHADYLVANYGKQSRLILDRLSDFSGEPEVALARAEVWYTVHYELAATLNDFFNRRTGRLYFDLPGIGRVLDPVIADFVTYLGWDEARVQEEKQALREAIRLVTQFEPAPRPAQARVSPNE